MLYLIPSLAPIAQGIEHRSPEPGAQVRILVGAPYTMKTGHPHLGVLFSVFKDVHLVYVLCFCCPCFLIHSVEAPRFGPVVSSSPLRQAFAAEFPQYTMGIFAIRKSRTLGRWHLKWSVRSLGSLRHILRFVCQAGIDIQGTPATHLSIQSQAPHCDESEDCRTGSIVNPCHKTDTSVA